MQEIRALRYTIFNYNLMELFSQGTARQGQHLENAASSWLVAQQRGSREIRGGTLKCHNKQLILGVSGRGMGTFCGNECLMNINTAAARTERHIDGLLIRAQITQNQHQNLRGRGMGKGGSGVSE